MNMVENIKAIAKAKKIPISRIERECGFSNGYIAQLKKGSMPADKLRLCANVLGVSQEELMDSDFISWDPHTQELIMQPKKKIYDRNTIVQAIDKAFGPIDMELETYYLDDESRSMAEFLFENPSYKVLFDASRKVKPEDIKKVAAMIKAFTTEEDND